MPPSKAPEPAGTWPATVASAAMIAQQVAGKAARDALFLSSFRVTILPYAMAASAIVSLAGVLWLTRLMTRYSPARVVPVCFAISGVGLLGEWALGFAFPQLSALAVYLHTAIFGAAVISAFWSLINEHFDPHTAKRAVARIAGGGTLGGVLGGLAAWRASSFIAVPTMLPLLAATNIVCLWGTLSLKRPASKESVPKPVSGPAEAAHEALSPFRVLRTAPYLRNLAFLVVLGAITSALLDYVFSAQAAKVYAKGPELLSFFALFWLAVGVLSFALQMLFGRIALEKLGLAVTVALLPGVVVLGGVLGLAVPGLLSTSILRGAEAVQRNSLFRSAYELLYTPLSEDKKRSTKTLIDVGFDRLGTVTASGIAMVVLYVTPERSGGILLAIGIGAALLTLTRSRRLHMGYVAVLEESLRQRSSRVSSVDIAPASERRDTIARDKIADKLDALPTSSAMAALSVGGPQPEPPLSALIAETPQQAIAELDQMLEAVAELRSGNAERVRRVLAANVPLSAPLVAFGILVLADNALYADAVQALRKTAPKASGQLLDALLDPSVDFVIRRRIPRVLTVCETQFAADGLMRGMADERFEVRYECGRALLRLTQKNPTIKLPLESIIATVKREAELSKDVWESQPLPELDEEEEEAPLIDRLLRDRMHRSLEHCFNVLALHLEREPLRIAFKALHKEDPRLRGTALEYLENVLPAEVRDLVWPFLGEARPMREPRPPEEILADLRRAPVEILDAELKTAKA